MALLNPLIQLLIGLYIMVLLLRIWMQWARADFYNPFSQFIVKMTQPVIRPLRRFIPSLGPIDTSSLLVAFVLCVLKAMLVFGMISAAPIIWIAALVILLKTTGTMIFWILIVRSLMSWVSQGRSPVEYVLMQLTEPLMAPIRRFIPPMGGLDLSAMVVILILYMLNYAGAYYFSWMWMAL